MTVESEVLRVDFDCLTTTVDAIQRAAYRYTDRFSLELRPEGDVFVCDLHLAPGNDPQAVTYGFRTEVLDQTLRERIRNETEGVRNLILAHAFSDLNAE